MSAEVFELLLATVAAAVLFWIFWRKGKSDSQAVEKGRRLRSRLERILNVARGYASGAFIGCGLAGRTF